MRVLVLAALIASVTVARADSPVASAKAFTGPEGAQVIILRLKPESEKKALLLIKGVGGDFEGKIIPHEVIESGDKIDYRTKYKGKDWVTVNGRVGEWTSSLEYELGAPGVARSIEVYYNKAATDALKSDDIYKQFQKQGSLDAISKFNRGEKERSVEKEIAALVATMQKDCGSKAKLTVNWKSINDDALMTYSIDDYCGKPADVIASLCRDSAAAKSSLNAKVKEVTCNFGKEAALRIQGTTLNWTVATDSVNLDDTIRNWLTNNL